ncbi:MAG TPA: glutamyl-tRNA reductase [Terriglobia bacterium]|nr:glutamyl-tRNA reductase [Terriglobia bacterium]
MEPTLVVIGLNHKTAAVEIRERFAISESRLYDALQNLSGASGIVEVAILSTCNRTEFVFWATDFEAACTSLVKFLTREYGLRLSEWQNFYRLMGIEALVHIFRVAASLDSLVVGEPEITGQAKSAWAKAKKAGTTGRFLDSVFQKAISVSKQVRNSTSIGASAVSIPYAAVELARQVFQTLEGRKVLILGAGKMSELSGRYLLNSGASTILVANRTYDHANELAEKIGGTAIRYEDRWQHVEDTNIIITSTGCPHIIFNREDAARVRAASRDSQLLLIDISVPRNIDPAVKDIPGVFLYNIDDLQGVVAHNMSERLAAAAVAEKIVEEEAQAFRSHLATGRLIPTLVALHDRLDEIGRQELKRYGHEAGPLSQSEQKAIEELASRITHRITGLLGCQLKETPEEQDQMAIAVHRLFQLPQKKMAGSAAATDVSVGNAGASLKAAPSAH